MSESGVKLAQTPADFCRQARRLRSVHRDPVKLHQALGRLRLVPGAGKNCSVVRHRATDAVEWISPDARPAGSASAFAALVASRMDGPILRYSARLSLLREAARRKIDRFEANLIIAAVQHRAGGVPKPGHVMPRRRVSVPVVVGILMMIEGLAVLGAWHFL